MSSAKWMLAATALGLVTWCFAAASVLPGFPADAMRIRFLVTVNDTWDTDGCIATVATPFLLADKLYNETEPITVGRCDKGPLDFHVQHGGSPDGYSSMLVNLTFHSSVIEDAGPPSCVIPWNGTYLNPTLHTMDRSPLPSCSLSDSREGWYLTYYWFRILEWDFGDDKGLATAAEDTPSVVVTFHSSVIEDASPPQCSIAWNGTYVQPTEDQMDLSPLPSCFTMESREGYHMTAYWFRLMEWHFQ